MEEQNNELGAAMEALALLMARLEDTEEMVRLMATQIINFTDVLEQIRNDLDSLKVTVGQLLEERPTHTASAQTFQQFMTRAALQTKLNVEGE